MQPDVPAPGAVLGPSTLTVAAAWAPLRSRAAVRDLLAEVGMLARRRGALELDLARLLAWLRRRDPVELGGVTWTAFCGEHVDWQGSWLRDMIRLAESPLGLVHRAVQDGILPLRQAVLAPGRVSVEGQEAWIAEAVLGPAEPELRDLVVYAGKDAERIRRARHLGRLLLGHAASAADVDAYILRCWRDRVPAERLLADARTPPSPPAPQPPLAWGAGVEPRTVAEAFERLDTLQAMLRGMHTVLARAWARITHEGLHAEAGYSTQAECAQDVLGMSHRSAQRLARLGWGLEWYPEIDAAVRAGMAPGTAERLFELGDDRATDWLVLAERVGRRELGRAVHDAREQRSSRHTLERYRRAVEIAERWASSPEGAEVLARPLVTEGDGATTAGGPALRVALRHPRPARFSSAPLRAPPELDLAAAWFLDTVVVPPSRGFARVKEDSDHGCTNPECVRRSIRTEAHHILPRSLGGSDELVNGTGACRMCHLRGIHAGRLRVEHLVIEGHDVLVWAWPGGKRTLYFRDEPGRPGVQ